MALMPRGAPRSVPDPAGDAYDEMMRGLRTDTRSSAYNDLVYRPQENAVGLRDLAYRPHEEPAVFTQVDGGRQQSERSRAGRASTPAPDGTGYFELGREWLTGEGPRRHEFRAGDPATEILRDHDFIQDLKPKIATNPPPVGEWDKANYSLKGWKGVPEFLKAYSAVFTGGKTGNLAAAYLGSYQLRYRILSVDGAGNANVEFVVDNNSSLGSATRPPYIGYTDEYMKYVADPLSRAVAKGPGSTTKQNFRWTEQIQLQRLPAQPSQRPTR